MSFDTSDATDSVDSQDLTTEVSENEPLTANGQASMSAGLDDTSPADDAPTPNTPATLPDQPADEPVTIYPHIGGKPEADYNKEAEGKSALLGGDEDQENSLEPPEGYHPGGPEGGW